MSQEGTKPRRQRRWLRRLGWALLCLLALVFAFRLIAGFVTQHAVDKRLDALRAEGEPILIPEMAPPELPPERNAAEVYAHAFALFGNRTSKPLHSVATLDKTRPLTDAEIEEARALVGQFAEAIRLVREGAERPECRFPIGYDTEPAMAILLPQLRGVQDAERLLGLSCRVNLADGKADAAAMDCLAMFRVARATEKEPFSISMFVEGANFATAARLMRETLDRTEPSAEALAKFPFPRPEEQARRRFARAMRGERCMGIDAFQGVLDGTFQSSGPADGASPPPAPRVRRPMSLTLSPLFLSDFSYYLDTMGRFVDAAGRPGGDGRERWKGAAGAVRAEHQHFRFTRMISGYLLPSLTGADDGCNRGLASERVALAGIALRRFRIDRGEYPDSPAALVPQYLPAVPKDPFADGDLLYRREGKGFVLYSVGPNGRDDGGTIDSRPGEGDIVWRLDR